MTSIIDTHDAVKFGGALILVLGLMLGLKLVLQRVNNLQPIRAPRKRRLGVVEVLPVDAKRRLILVRRDGVEHLILLGANGEAVIETGIESAQDGETHAPVLPSIS